jgi:hypothetical protein
VEEETIGDGSSARAGMVNTQLKRTEARFELLITGRRDDDTGGFVWCSRCVDAAEDRMGERKEAGSSGARMMEPLACEA